MSYTSDSEAILPASIVRPPKSMSKSTIIFPYKKSRSSLDQNSDVYKVYCKKNPENLKEQFIRELNKTIKSVKNIGNSEELS